MAISLDRLVNVHHDALKVRAQRMEVISGNLANANTPGYKARDIDFTKAMKSAQSTQAGSSMVKTHDKHMSGGSRMHAELDFRIQTQPDTGDGNNVDSQVERNAFLEAGMRYQAGVMLLDGKFKGMKKALSSGG
ncbi:MAG: flagellar basal-body rod protein FlgB [Kangiellaceae bacterium]|jgi:flagellar basal-body rod protein FlgB